MIKNNKGFMMAEVVVVSAIALIALGTLYVSYNKIYSSYVTRINYNDMKALNRLVFFRDLLIEDYNDSGSKINELITETKGASGKIKDITGEIKLNDANNDIIDPNNDANHGYLVSETTFLYNNQKDNFDSSIFNGMDVNQTYKDYIDYLSESADFSNTNFVMLIERCYTEDDCKYAYLDIYD